MANWKVTCSVSTEEAVQPYLAGEAGMSHRVYNVGVAQILGEGYLHGGPIRGALYVLVLLWGDDLHTKRTDMRLFMCLFISTI